MVEIILVIGLAIIWGQRVAERFRLITPLVLIALGALIA